MTNNTEDWRERFDEHFPLDSFDFSEESDDIKAFIAQERALAAEEAVANVPVGFVRQWINENLLKPGHALVEDEDIRRFISIGAKSLTIPHDTKS